MLNQAQREAVTTTAQSVLVLAGPGSGKTEVITKRIAHRIKNDLLEPGQILAVTFTNKASREMSERLRRELAQSINGLWIGTFHSICYRILIEDAEKNEKKRPRVLDKTDSLKIISDIISNDDDDDVEKSFVQKFIDDCKNQGIRSQYVTVQNTINYNKKFVRIYQDYEKHLKRINALDFGDLILSAYELLKYDNELLNYYRNLFKAIHVDEFQDTNFVQYNLIKILAQNDLFVVGDENQSIYGWRGADIGNVLRFTSDFYDPQVIRLEQNYRSTVCILNAANNLIKHNTSSMKKTLFSDKTLGEKIAIKQFKNDKAEADFVACKILEIGGDLNDFAILYRNNALSRLIEDSLIRKGINYKIYGGSKFFEREEIKTALAYLRLANDFHDDVSFKRVVNTPTRRIGLKITDKIWHYAKNNDCSLFTATSMLLINEEFSKTEQAAVSKFYNLILDFGDDVVDMDLSESISNILDKTGLCEYYSKKEGKVENLQELVSAAASFAYNPDEGMSKTEAFLLYSTLDPECKTDSQDADGQDAAVSLMTIHKSKGLEYETVFLIGNEETVLPSHNSDIEEERRLAYVAITRAKIRLFLTFSNSRMKYGGVSSNPPSRFIEETLEIKR